MTTIDQRNDIWETELNGLNLALWERMNALGVQAAWEHTVTGSDPEMTEQVGTMRRAMARSEFYEFVVKYQGEVLETQSRHDEDFRNVEINLLISAARTLEERGLTIFPR
ncbi:hypothetical protein [Deinococcus sonorensis]|uniref:Uncharacterized protein n=2 Tax=Deinococcus sonorensis TaxID=309891 RepID=A0AAU7UBQ9_9DEIO